MKRWKCPNCKRIDIYFGDLILKVCRGCMEKMEVEEVGKKT